MTGPGSHRSAWPGRGWPEPPGPQPRPRGAAVAPRALESRPAQLDGPPRPVREWQPPRPVRVPPRRTAGDIVAGIGALLALIGLVGGVPYALIRLAGPPISPELLDPDLFTSRVGPETIIAILILLVWLAWFQLLLCVIVEVWAGVRRVGMPARVPFSGGTQALANRLVTAALLLFTATTVAAPVAGVGVHGPARPEPIRPEASVLAAPVAGTADTADADRAPLQARKVKKVYVVQPPHGRHHESLWEIAEKCLGDGRRYHEIYRLNQHKEQPDGSRLRLADLIRPGWVLDMPDDAINVHIVPVDEDRPDILSEHRDAPVELDGGTHYAHSGGAGPGEQRQDSEPTQTPRIVLPPPALPERPAAASPSAPAATPVATAAATPNATGSSAHGSGTAGDAPAAGDREDGAGLELVDYLAAATLTAAGLLALLGRRRREQLWRRAFGRRIARPRGDAADAEVAIRLGADAPGSRMLDIGLRLLGRLLAERGRRPPTIYAVHLSSRGLDLWIHPADDDSPEPWESCDDGQVWRLPAHEGRRIDEHALAGVPAPYPGLVSLGAGQGGRVLIDLEAAHGVIAMTGAHTVAALSALAVELATNRWSDDMRITLVGFGEELTLLAPDRIKVAGSLGEVLPELEKRAEELARGADDVLTGRVHARVADPAWTPHYLLSAIAPDEDEARRLALLGKGMRTVCGFVVAGPVPHATWTWEITEDGRARLDALGFEVDAHLLPRRHYDAVVTLFRTAQRTDGEPLTMEPESAQRPSAARAWEELPDDPPAIEVRILGPIEITSVPDLEEGRAALAQELVVYLATHPEGVHPAVLGGVLWPRGVQAAVRDATIARVSEWLGVDSQGRPHLYRDDAGRLRLGPEVRTDWRQFQDLVRRAAACAGDEAEAVLLERALRLVRGPLLSGRPGNRYAWLAADPLEYDVPAWVADVAHALCEIRLAQGDPEAAVAAVRAGLLLAADDEGLWRDLLRAAHATGDPGRLRAVVDGLRRRAASHPYGGIAPETEALMDELLPDWRRTPVPDLSTPRLA